MLSERSGHDIFYEAQERLLFLDQIPAFRNNGDTDVSDYDHRHYAGHHYFQLAFLNQNHLPIIGLNHCLKEFYEQRITFSRITPFFDLQ
jgi:hypothetical protein